MPPNLQSSNSSSKNSGIPLFSHNGKLQRLLETVKLPTHHPDANFPKKPPPSLNPTFGKSEPWQPIVTQKVALTKEMTHMSSLKPTPINLSNGDFVVLYLCKACQKTFKSAAKHRAHVLSKKHAKKIGDDLKDAPTFVFLNKAPIGMNRIKMKKTNYFCTLCYISFRNAHDTVRHVCSGQHWTIYWGRRQKTRIPPSLYISEIGEYLDAYPFVSSVKKVALSKKPVLVFDEVKLASANSYSVDEIFDLAALSTLKGFFESFNESIGPEYVKQFIDDRGQKRHWYCEACNCQLKYTTKLSRKEHTKSRQHHAACEKNQELNVFAMLCENFCPLLLIR